MVKPYQFSFYVHFFQSLSDMSEIDIESYQGNMETVLTWLLEAEGHLENQEPISGNVDEVKEQFHTHEVRDEIQTCVQRLKVRG